MKSLNEEQRKRLLKIADNAFKWSLVILAVFGILQFIIIFTIAIFGANLLWSQYMASVVMFLVSLALAYLLMRVWD